VGSATAYTGIGSTIAIGIIATKQDCIYGTAEYQIRTTQPRPGELPARYTGTHSHGAEMHDDTLLPGVWPRTD